MKIQQLLSENTPTSIDNIPGLRNWMSTVYLKDQDVEVHDDGSISINKGLPYLEIGNSAHKLPTKIRKIAGDLDIVAENANYQEGSKLNIHKWIKQVDGDVRIEIGTPCPILSFLLVNIGGELDVRWQELSDWEPEDDNDEPLESDYNMHDTLHDIMASAHADHKSPLDVQQELIDAGYTAFARM